MLFVLIGAVLLLLAVSTVKTVTAKGATPYFLSYLIVIGAGFWGLASFTTAIPMIMTRPIEAAVIAIISVASIGVMCWGLTSFKRIYEEA